MCVCVCVVLGACFEWSMIWVERHSQNLCAHSPKEGRPLATHQLGDLRQKTRRPSICATDKKVETDVPCRPAIVSQRERKTCWQSLMAKARKACARCARQCASVPSRCTVTTKREPRAHTQKDLEEGLDRGVVFERLGHFEPRYCQLPRVQPVLHPPASFAVIRWRDFAACLAFISIWRCAIHHEHRVPTHELLVV